MTDNIEKEDVYLGALGRWTTASDRHAGTHYVLRHEDYNAFLKEIRTLEAELNETRQKAAADLGNERQKAAGAISRAKSDARKETDAAVSAAREEASRAQRQAREWKAQLEHEESLNRNLIRIATERAARARGLDKKDPGYLILNWQTYSYKRTVKPQNSKKTEVQRFNLCRITIQTPWDCSLKQEDVDVEVLRALKSRVLDIGSGYEWFTQNLTLDTALDNIAEGDRMILRREYRSNVKEGLWEVTLTTNFEPVVKARHRKKYV